MKVFITLKSISYTAFSSSWYGYVCLDTFLHYLASFLLDQSIQVKLIGTAGSNLGVGARFSVLEREETFTKLEWIRKRRGCTPLEIRQTGSISCWSCMMHWIVLVSGFITLVLSPVFACADGFNAPVPPAKDNPPRVAFQGMPLRFVANAGQVDPHVMFYARASGYTLWVTAEGMVFDVVRAESSKTAVAGGSSTGLEKEAIKREVTRLSFPGAVKMPELEALEEAECRVNVIRGPDCQHWKTGIPTFQSVMYRGIYEGIDLKVYGMARQVEYDWIVGPGADPGRICLKYAGVRGSRIDDKGDLRIETVHGELIHRRPLSYQEFEGRRVAVASGYRKTGEDTYAFEVGSYDRSRPLVIDPVVVTQEAFLGGAADDFLNGAAVDCDGQAYLAGITLSSDFPLENSCRVDPNDTDIFLVQIDTTRPAAENPVYATYLGGSGQEFGGWIAAGDDGNVYITGWTDSPDFPVLAGCQLNLRGDADAFLIRIDTTRKGVESLIYATYFGGTGGDLAYAVAVDGRENAYIAGSTDSLDLAGLHEKFRSGFQPQPKGGQDAFMVQLDTRLEGSESLVYATHLGGSQHESGLGVAVNSRGLTFVTGSTFSFDFPVLNGCQPELSGRCDAFLACLDTAKEGHQGLVYATFVGGEKTETGYGVAVDDRYGAVLVGDTESRDFPVLNGCQTALRGGVDVFAAKIDTTRSGSEGLVYSTYLGGSGIEACSAVALDVDEHIYVTGQTASLDFPVRDGYQGGLKGESDVFVVTLDTGLSSAASLVFSAFLGGEGREYGSAVAAGSNGTVYVAGVTDGPRPDNGALAAGQPAGTRHDLFLIVLGENAASGVDLSIGKDVSNANPSKGEEIAFTLTAMNHSTQNATQVAVEDLLPAGLVFVSAFTAVGGYDPHRGLWHIGDLAAGGSVSLDIVVQVSAGAAGRIENRAEIRSAENDVHGWDNTAVATVYMDPFHMIRATAGPNGRIHPAGEIYGNQGSAQTFTITPDAGYVIKNVLVDGASVGAVARYTFPSIVVNHTIHAVFAEEGLVNGDLNEDGEITVQDAKCALDVSLGICPTDCGACDELPSADVDRDGSVTAADAQCILDKAMGRPSCLD